MKTGLSLHTPSTASRWHGVAKLSPKQRLYCTRRPLREQAQRNIPASHHGVDLGLGHVTNEGLDQQGSLGLADEDVAGSRQGLGGRGANDDLEETCAHAGLGTKGRDSVRNESRVEDCKKCAHEQQPSREEKSRKTMPLDCREQLSEVVRAATTLHYRVSAR